MSGGGQSAARLDGVMTALRGRLVVSCQAYPGDALLFPEAMLAMAKSALAGGAAGIRAQGIRDIRLLHEDVPLPLIGLLKVPGDDVFITPTLASARAVALAGADVVALDGTRRPRPDGMTLSAVIRSLHEEFGIVVMADCASLDDAIAAEDSGADIVGTTLAGYTSERDITPGPDLELVRVISRAVSVPLFAEGRIRTPVQARAALDAGADAVVVGTAITHPATITSWFVEAL